MEQCCWREAPLVVGFHPRSQGPVRHQPSPYPFYSEQDGSTNSTFEVADTGDVWSQMWDIIHQSICRFKSLICRIKTINHRIKSINRCIKSINHRIKLSFCIVNPLHQTVISFSQSVNLLFHSIASFCNVIS